MALDVRYVASPQAFLTPRAGAGENDRGSVPMLLGARVHIDMDNRHGEWVASRGLPNTEGRFHEGFMRLDHLSETQQLKIFYIDVGQGDASLIEAQGAIVIIDGGPNDGLHKYLLKRLHAMRRADQALGLAPREQLFIDAVFVSHFDLDHYRGLTALLRDRRFRFGVLYHNGLPRYGASGGRDLDLGDVVRHRDGSRSISTDFSGLASARALASSGDFLTARGNHNQFWHFLDALLAAHDGGRLRALRRLVTRRTEVDSDVVRIGPDLEFQVLGPLTTRSRGSVRLPCFPDPHKVHPGRPAPAPSSSHTINGNSVVLRLVYGGASFLFGGDLNQPAQHYLRERYGDLSSFRSDVNKACHHGSSDFDVGFLMDVFPCATVFSSGDNGNYDHPLPDAIGAAAKYSNGDFPLVFSTELARDNLAGGRIKFGHINARSNGRDIVVAQRKESAGRSNKIWHSFAVPYGGPFHGQ